MTPQNSTLPEMHDLCGLDELRPGVPVEVTIGRRRVGVVRVGDTVRVFGGSCPHHGGPLAQGRVRRFISSDCPGEIDVNDTRLVVTCPWHNWEYDLDSGKALFDAQRRIPIYKAHIVDGRVVTYEVEMGSGDVTTPNPPHGET